MCPARSPCTARGLKGVKAQRNGARDLHQVRTGAWASGGRLLAALLHVRLHELLGIALEHFIDLIKEIVELGLELLAALVGGRCGLFSFVGALWRWLLLLRSLCHFVLSSVLGLLPLRRPGYAPSLPKRSAAVGDSSSNLPTISRV